MRGRLALAALLLSGCIAPAAAIASMRAEQITAETAPELFIGGPDAIGGVGDWYLANDVVEVIVDDPGRRFAKLNHGGTIVDAGLRDRDGEDQFARIFPVVNMDQSVFIDFDSIRAEMNEEEGWARLVVSNAGRMHSVQRKKGWKRWFDPLVPETDELRHVAVETEYAVFRDEPFVHITTTFRNAGPHPAPIISYGDVWMRGGRSGRSWVGNTLDPVRSRGFHHLNFDRRNLLAAGDAMAAFTHVSVPGMPQYPPIAYAIFAPERAARQLRQFGVTGKHVTLINAYANDPDWEEMSLMRLAVATRNELPPGESWTFRRRLLITGRADTASTTDVIFPLLGYADGTSGIAGRIEPANVRTVIHVSDAGTGAPITQIATTTEGEEAGAYRAILPPGEYELAFRAAQRRSRKVAVAVPPGRFAAVPTVAFEPPGWLLFDPALADGGPGRVIVQGIGDTADPIFGPELLDFRIDGRPGKSGTATNEIHFIGNDHDPTRVAIPPGSYRLTATRGFEHDIEALDVEVSGPGSEVRVLPFSLPRVIGFRGIVSADLHVHAQASDDSGMTNEARLRSFVAEGVDVIVTTDHDHLGFFAPALDALGVRGRIRVIQGVEVTSSAPSPAAPWSIGHHNAWPIPYAPLAHRRGAPPSQNMTVADLYASLRHTYGARVVQLNHPREANPEIVDQGAFFSHLGTAGEGYDPTRPIDSPPNDRLLEPSSDGSTRAVDFDAMEVMNGRSFAQYLWMRADWHSLLRQGLLRTGTANSDTHGPDQPAGYPRNYVYLDADQPEWDEGRWNAAIRQGRTFGTNGPLIAVFTANGARMGDLVAAPGGIAIVELGVAAAPWVPVEEVRLLANGEVVRRYAAADLAADAVVRVRDRAELALEKDVFLTLEAGVPLDVDPQSWATERGGVYAATIAPGFVPTAFANPIFIDVDGDGDFDAPGLPPPPRDWKILRTGLSVGVAGLLLATWWLRRRRA
jgi:hypothetical protein